MNDDELYKAVPKLSASYEIDFDNEVEELAVEGYAKYYFVTNPEIDEDLFAIIYDKYLPWDIEVIDKLKNNKNISGLNNVVDYGTLYSKSFDSSNFVVIVRSYNLDDRLSNFIENNGTLDRDESTSIIAQIANTIQELSDINIFGYSINTDNILVKSNNDGTKSYVLREFIASYPNYVQKHYYLAPEFFGVHDVSRCPMNSKSDVFALGILAFGLYSNIDLYKLHNDLVDYEIQVMDGDINNLWIKHIKSDLSNKMLTFMLNVLDPEINNRWSINEVLLWFNDHDNVVVNEKIYEPLLPISFNNRTFRSLKSLAYGIYLYQDKAQELISSDKIYSWISTNKLGLDLLNKVKNLLISTKSVSFNLKKLFDKSTIYSLISILDHSAPIRYNNISFTLNAVDNLLYHFMYKQQFNNIRSVIHILTKKVNSNLVDSLYYDAEKLEYYKDILPIIDSEQEIVKAIYNINKNKPCLHNIFKNYFVVTIEDFLVTIDMIASDNNNPYNILLDNHLIMFIMTKLSKDVNIEYNLFSVYPKLAHEKFVLALQIFDILQKKFNDIDLSNVFNAMTKIFEDFIFQNIHNKEFKDSIVKNLDKKLEDKRFSRIIELINDDKKFLEDQKGYNDALDQLKSMDQELERLDNQTDVKNNIIIGQKITVLISYFLCLTIAIFFLLY